MIKLPGQKLNTPVTFPVVLSRSRDYNAVEVLLQTVFNYFYTLSKESKNIHNPRRCKVELLPLLADYYRYQYTDVKDVSLEREIIATVPELHHNKGTNTGINNALALSKVDKTDQVVIPWFYSKENNTITVIILVGIETYKLMDLLKLVVPLGTRVITIPGKFIKASEEVKMHSWTEVHFGALDPDKQWYVTKNNTWHTVWDETKQLYHTYVDYQRNIGDNDMKINVIDPATGDVVTGTSENTAGTRVGNIEIAKNGTEITTEKGENT